jgi:hypothetical protein
MRKSDLSDRINKYIAKSKERDERIRAEMNAYLSKIPEKYRPHYERESKLFRGYMKIKENEPKK